jgi:RNA polymerase sigma factor (sigma-70 family)
VPGDTSAPARFPTTRWSAVVGVRSEERAERRRSWEALVAAYWKPVYKHLRLKWKKPRADAEDGTQAFFTRALEREFFSTYDPSRARFRTFVRLCADRFVANELKAQNRLKRGGDTTMVSLDFDAAEEELARVSAGSPEECFDREWRRSLFALAIDKLRETLEQKGKRDHFAIFERYDLCESDRRPTYEELGRELGVPATTITNRLASTRSELRRLVLAELEAVTETPEELRSEAKLLFGVEPA